MRVWVKQRDARAGALAGRVVTVPGHSDRLPLVREVESAQLRVRSAVVAVPYIERDVHQQVAQALGPGGAVLLVGHSMAGKTRLAAHVVGQRFPGAALLIPASGKALRDLVIDEGLDVAGVVVWLDGLERFLRPDGLTTVLLDRLMGGNAILVATIRREERDKIYLPQDTIRPLGWRCWTGSNGSTGRGSPGSTCRAATPSPSWRGSGPRCPIRASLLRCSGVGWPNFWVAALGGRQFERGETSEPVGYALVRAAVDWRRSGLTRAIAEAGPG